MSVCCCSAVFTNQDRNSFILPLLCPLLLLFGQVKSAGRRSRPKLPPLLTKIEWVSFLPFSFSILISGLVVDLGIWFWIELGNGYGFFNLLVVTGFDLDFVDVVLV